MAAVEVTISGVLYDKYSRTTRPVVLIGEASLTGLGVGGGPIIPPGGGEGPPHIWGPPDMPPGFWGGGMGPGVKPQPHPEHPIVIPPPGGGSPPGFPGVTPPNPGDPTTPIPPPPGSDGWPVSSIVPPPYVIINYPGIGPVKVAPPVTPAQSG